MATLSDNKIFFDRVEKLLKKLVEHLTKPKLPRTVVGFVFDILDSSTLEFVNTLEGHEHRLDGIGIVQIVTLLQFQLIVSHEQAVTIIALVEYRKIRDIEDEPVLGVDTGDNSVPGSSEVAAD